MPETVSYYDRLRDAARELFGDETDFEFCHVRRRNHYHVIRRGSEILCELRLKGVPDNKRITRTFEYAAEAVGNVPLETVKEVLAKHRIA